MSGRKQHTIPAFFLRGFASSQKGDEYFVYLHRKGEGAVEVNVKNVSAQRDFYGDPRDEPELDDAITKLEDEYAPMVDGLRHQQAGRAEVAAADLRGLALHLSMRTRQIRESFRTLYESIFRQVEEKLSTDKIAEGVIRKMMRSPDWFLRRMKINGFTPEQMTVAGADFERNRHQIATDGMEQMKGAFFLSLRQFVFNRLDGLKEVVRDGHNQSVMTALRADVQSLIGQRWFVVHSPVDLVLGDSVCVFELRGDRRFSPIFDSQANTLKTFLPLTPNRILVGTQTNTVVDFEAIRQAVIRCSMEFVVSPNPPENGDEIGKWAGIMTDRQITKTVGEMRRDFLQKFKVT